MNAIEQVKTQWLRWAAEGAEWQEEEQEGAVHFLWVDEKAKTTTQQEQATKGAGR